MTEIGSRVRKIVTVLDMVMMTNVLSYLILKVVMAKGQSHHLHYKLYLDVFQTKYTQVFLYNFEVTITGEETFTFLQSNSTPTYPGHITSQSLLSCGNKNF